MEGYIERNGERIEVTTCVVIYGNFTEGFQFTGPFESRDKAREWIGENEEGCSIALLFPTS